MSMKYRTQQFNMKKGNKKIELLKSIWRSVKRIRKILCWLVSSHIFIVQFLCGQKRWLPYSLGEKFVWLSSKYFRSIRSVPSNYSRFCDWEQCLVNKELYLKLALTKALCFGIFESRGPLTTCFIYFGLRRLLINSPDRFIYTQDFFKSPLSTAHSSTNGSFFLSLLRLSLSRLAHSTWVVLINKLARMHYDELKEYIGTTPSPKRKGSSWYIHL